MPVNRQYKDRLFKKIFEEKENALSLYNAVNGTDYSNVDDLEIYTIEDAIYMGMKNDVSFLFNDEINLYEQQSTVNPNMPVRDLIYLAKQYDRYIDSNDIWLYGSRLKKLPAPRCVVFYNGDTDKPEVETMDLADAFGEKGELSSLNLKVTVYNINYPRNMELLQKCRALHDYSVFVDMVKRGRRDGLSLEQAVDSAVDKAATDKLLGGYFANRRAEVRDMILTEYDEKRVMKDFYEEGREEGSEDRAMQIAARMKACGMPVEEIAGLTGLTKEQIEAL